MPSPSDRQPLDLTEEEWLLLAAFSEADAIRAQQDANKHTKRTLLALGFILLSLRRIRPAQLATPTGKPLPVLSPRQVRTVLNRYIDGTAWEMRAMAESYRTGGMALSQWELRMLDRIKSTHYGATALQRGGYERITNADIADLERIIQREYKYLSKFARDIADGVPLDGRYLRRAEMYGRAGRGTFYEFMGQEMRQAGAVEEANVLRPGDVCRGCQAQTARGWVPLGTLVPIGQRDCLSSCRCGMIYRDALGTEMVV